MTKLRISIVQYLNTAPLVWGFTNGPLRGKYDLSFTVPSQCAEALRTADVDIAIIPAIEYQRIEGLVVLPDISIASKNRVRSLLVVSKKPMAQVQSIALDRGSRSTQALTRILCAEHWNIAPEFFEAPPDLPAMLQHADAALLIGDPALRLAINIEAGSWLGESGEIMCQAARAGISGTEPLHVYDIVEEWKKMTGQPAVLAVWAARRNAAKEKVIADFASSRDYGMAHITEISSAAASELDLPHLALAAYLTSNIDFSLDAENKKGLEYFYARAAAFGLIPRAKPMEWALGAKESASMRAT